MEPMKKTLSIIATLTLLLAGVSAHAQKAFGHLSVGVDLLSSEGFGLQVATTLTPHLQLRGNFTFMDAHTALVDGILKGIGKNRNIDALKNGITPFRHSITGLNMDPTPSIHIDRLDVEAYFQSRNLEILLDYLPFKNSGFHLSAGLVFALTPRLVKGTVVAYNAGQPAIPASSRTSLEVLDLTTDKDGFFHFGVQNKWNIVRPYLGIGFGRPVSLKHRVGVNFDLGIQYTGGSAVTSLNYYDNPDRPKTVYLDKAWIDRHEDVKNALGKDYKDATDALDQLNKWPILPVMKLSLFVRIF